MLNLASNVVEDVVSVCVSLAIDIDVKNKIRFFFLRSNKPIEFDVEVLRKVFIETFSLRLIIKLFCGQNVELKRDYLFMIVDTFLNIFSSLLSLFHLPASNTNHSEPEIYSAAIEKQKATKRKMEK